VNETVYVETGPADADNVRNRKPKNSNARLNDAGQFREAKQNKTKAYQLRPCGGMNARPSQDDVGSLMRGVIDRPR
jgi:hypothetical protein